MVWDISPLRKVIFLLLLMQWAEEVGIVSGELATAYPLLQRLPADRILFQGKTKPFWAGVRSGHNS